MGNAGKQKAPKKHQGWLDADPDRARTSSFRMGGIGSMLAVSTSTGAGTGFHYDEGDDSHFYSAIVVLGTPGTLKLPELGLEIEAYCRRCRSASQAGGVDALDRQKLDGFCAGRSAPRLLRIHRRRAWQGAGE
ncbi:hypothetical protein M3J09_010876 [Ascochyta lentis]